MDEPNKNIQRNGFELEADERALFVFTHPDDEISLAAFIWRLQKQGVPLEVIWTHSTPEREAESRQAMSKIGVRDDQLHFLAGKDGAIVDDLKRLQEEVLEIVERFKPTRVVTHAFEQGHLDHDATNLLVHLSFQGPIFEAPFYHTYLNKLPTIYRFSTSQGEQKRLLSETELKLKLEMLDCYPSQTIRRNLKLYELARKLGLRKENLLKSERLRLQTHFDYKMPNHPDKIVLEIQASQQWRRWLKAIENFV